MEYYLVTPLRMTHATNAELTYSFDSVLTIGSIVMVSVGKTSYPGVITGKTDKPPFETKPIESTVTAEPLPMPLVNTAAWMSSYYVTHPVQVWQTILPRGINKKRRESKKAASYPKRERTTIVLNDEQKAAIELIMAHETGTKILHGVTGSGKTQVYIELTKQTLDNGRSVILLVPEIALTSQLIAEFLPHFPEAVVTHSTMTESERHSIWQKQLVNDKPQLVIGPRSALFSPIKDIGLIIIDECHEPSFKQEQSPRYSALRTASTLARFHNARLVLGSATPSVTDYYLAKHTNSPIAIMSKPARKDTVAPEVTVVDMTKRLHFRRHPFLSDSMIARLKTTIESGHQALFFHNRRGTAPITLCENCGWSPACPRCFVPLTLHADSYELRCHICNHQETVPTSCPTCSHANIIHKGIGTKLLQDELQKLFPKAKIARFDGDTLAENTLEKQYQALYDGEIDIIIGTQVVAKGLDLPYLRMVGVVQADSGLSLPDYQSAERVFQLIYQVCGRVGRNEHESHVVVQSYQPNHPAVNHGIARDYQAFYEHTLEERKRGYFPPYTHLMKMVCIYKTESAAIRASRDFAMSLRSLAPSHVQILGPTPAFYERVRDTYRWQLVIKSHSRQDLVELAKHIPPIHWQYELDPNSLL